ncbi:PAS domain S-box protein [Nocardioides mangrovi]|uniref:Sensor-like histidine kinase SenX3 n=1 Tax=Nocardioides mangrovi TaxID=2874580 RepID=A0ABS7U6Z2_9ACTN|nr:PAS domain S-box protein [Nocardioides mangrovi]MBZ5736610.1 PAS domain S-box protein [Nocardioides mangrovi]
MGEPPPPDVLLRGVVESVPDAVVVVDADGRIVLTNSQCRATFGWDPEELVGLSVEVLVPTSRQSDERQYRADPRLPTGLLRVTAMRSDGTEFPAEVSMAPISAEGYSYVSATIRDITERVNEEERFRSLLDAAPDATVIIDDTATIVLVNDRVEEMVGFTRSELLGRSLVVLAAAPEPEEILERIGNYLREPESVPMGYSQEFRVRHRDGHDLPVEISLSPLETADGLLVSIALRDLTERRRLEAESHRLRDDLIASVSHELRTPLTSIIGYAELMADLDEADLSRRARKLLSVIERNATRELQLVNDLLTMAFLDDDRLRMLQEALDLDMVCERVVENLRLRARERALTLVFLGGEAKPVIGDLHRVIQVVENIVTNSLKFTHAGGRIELSVEDDGEMGVVEIRDTGIGVSPEDQARLFERLYRAPRAVADQVPGAGLGLSIARAIVEAHGGWITLNSELGVGTVVRVALPHHVRPIPAP